MPFDLLNCHYLQTEGVQGTGGWPTLGSRAISRTLFPLIWSGSCQRVESNNTTAKKKKKVPQWKVLYTATPLLSPATLLSLDPLPCYSQCDICTLCYVDMCRCVCMCAYVCVYSSLPHVFLASGLALSPALPPMIGLLPPVMSRRAQCWNEKAAVLPCSWVSCLRVLTSLPFVGEARFLCLFLWDVSILVFKRRSDFSMELNIFTPRVFRGKDIRNVFFGKRFGCLIASCSSSTTQGLTFSLPSSPFLTFFCHFFLVVRHLDPQFFSVASV